MEVDLYEDGAGRLWMVCGEVCYEGLEGVPNGQFRADALELASGDTGNWTLPRALGVPDDARLVTTAIVEDGAYAAHGSWGVFPGASALRYLGDSAEPVLADAIGR